MSDNDCEKKHLENRNDIAELRREQRAMSAEVQELKGRIDPYLDNGQPGLFSKMSAKIDMLLAQVTGIQIAQAVGNGRADVYDWLRTALTSIIVGGLLILGQHFWK